MERMSSPTRYIVPSLKLDFMVCRHCLDSANVKIRSDRHRFSNVGYCKAGNRFGIVRLKSGCQHLLPRGTVSACAEFKLLQKSAG